MAGGPVRTMDLQLRWTSRLAGPRGLPRTRRQDASTLLLQPTFTSRALDVDITSGGRFAERHGKPAGARCVASGGCVLDGTRAGFGPMDCSRFALRRERRSFFGCQRLCRSGPLTPVEPVSPAGRPAGSSIAPARAHVRKYALPALHDRLAKRPARTDTLTRAAVAEHSKLRSAMVAGSRSGRGHVNEGGFLRDRGAFRRGRPLRALFRGPSLRVARAGRPGRSPRGFIDVQDID